MIRAAGSELPQHQVIKDRMEPLGSARPAVTPPVNALQAQFPHEAFNTLAGAAHSMPEPQLSMNPGTAVSAVTPLMSIPDQFTEAFILQSPLRWKPGTPGVVAAPGDLQQAAHDSYRVIGLLSVNEPVDYFRFLVSSAKDRKSTRLNSSHVAISYAVFCLKKKTKQEQ